MNPDYIPRFFITVFVIAFVALCALIASHARFGVSAAPAPDDPRLVSVSDLNRMMEQAIASGWQPVTDDK